MSQVEEHRLDLNAVRAREPVRHIVERALAPRCEDQIDASLGKAGKLTPEPSDAPGTAHGP